MEKQLDSGNKSSFFHILNNYTITDSNNYLLLLAIIFKHQDTVVRLKH